MRQKFTYTSMNTLLAKLSRDLRGVDISESDIIEWAGEALGFMKLVEIQEEALAFLEVKDYQAEIPEGFQYVIQIARNNSFDTKEKMSSLDILNNMNCGSVLKTESATQDCRVITDNHCEPIDCNKVACTDCNGNLLNEPELAYYRPYFDLKYEYSWWMESSYYRESYTPVRLANHSFMGSLVAEVPEEVRHGLYAATTDEYTIVGGYPNLCLRFSFKDGLVALSYVRAKIDSETGYPLIPDDTLFLNAITYYIKWKLAERLRWNGREGFVQEAQDAERLWRRYLRQALNRAKMPQGVDDYQDLLEESLYLIPRHRKYYGFFGKLGREEQRLFNNPDMRRKYSRNRYGGY